MIRRFFFSLRWVLNVFFHLDKVVGVVSVPYKILSDRFFESERKKL